MRWLTSKLLANLSDQVNGADTTHLPGTRGITTIFSMTSLRNIKLTLYNIALLHTNFLECTHWHQQHSDQKRGWSSLCAAACPAIVHNWMVSFTKPAYLNSTVNLRSLRFGSCNLSSTSRYTRASFSWGINKQSFFHSATLSLLYIRSVLLENTVETYWKVDAYICQHSHEL